jgi:hypothetical protein
MRMRIVTQNKDGYNKSTSLFRAKRGKHIYPPHGENCKRALNSGSVERPSFHHRDSSKTPAQKMMGQTATLSPLSLHRVEHTHCVSHVMLSDCHVESKKHQEKIDKSTMVYTPT